MAHDGCNYFHFGLSGIFPSTFLQPVNGYKNSILNWVIKLSLIKLPMKFYSFQKNCCCCRQTMRRLCFYSQRERWKQIFQQYGDLKLKKFCFGAHLGSNSRRYLFKQRVKKLNLWRRTAVDKSAWIKAFLYFSLSFWAISCHFTPFTAQKIIISKKLKNMWRYHNFTQFCQKSWSYAILFLRYAVWWMQLLFLILGYFLPFYPPKSPKNENFKTMEKNTWIYHHFTQVYQRCWLDDVWFLRYGTRQTDGWTDGWKKWNRGGYPT